MPRVNRREIFAGDEIQAFHLINRCVRRTYLCGKDKNRERTSHRKQWIRDRLEVLAGIFGLIFWACGTQQSHACRRQNAADVVKTWSDDDKALRWWNLFPQRKNKDGTPAVATRRGARSYPQEFLELQEKRRRLSNVSWFMKCLSEPIATRKSGRKFQAIFGKLAEEARSRSLMKRRLRRAWPSMWISIRFSRGPCVESGDK
ncbi:MAG: hypothetical protein R3C17_13380 [Planctomycetaceae bacterium]